MESIETSGTQNSDLGKYAIVRLCQQTAALWCTSYEIPLLSKRPPTDTIETVFISPTGTVGQGGGLKLSPLQSQAKYK